MPWGDKFPDLKNDPSYLDPRLTAVEQKASNNAASLAQKTTQPEQYGCKGDGVTDDTTNFTSYVNDCISKGKTMEMNGNYKITSPITINGNGKAVNFIVNGSIIATGSGIVLTNIKGGRQRIVLMGGGTSSSIGVQTSNCLGLKLEVYADAYGGTVLKNGGNKQDGTNTSFSNTSLFCRNGCYQALVHGDNIVGKYQDAFGSYEFIYDFDSLNGIVFQNSNDITIKHIENHFYDTGNAKDSLTFNNAGAVHCDNIAIGGRSRQLINVIASTIDINKLYTVNEDPSTLISIGLTVDNTSNLFINQHRDSRSKIAVNFPTIGGILSIKTIITGGSGSAVTAGGTDLLLPTSGLTSYTNSGFLTSSQVRPSSKGGANQLLFANINDLTKTHYGLGENNTDNTFRIEVYDINTGAWKSVPVQIDKDGNTRIGVSSAMLGFFGSGGSTKPSVTGTKGTRASSDSLRTALSNMGLLTDNTGNIVTSETVLSPTASPYYYTNNYDYPVQVLVQGGTVSGISIAKVSSGSYSNTGLTQGLITLAPSDNLSVTYSAVPTMKVFPL